MLLEEKSQNQKSYKKKLNSISQKKKTKSNSWPPPRFNLNLTLITLEITCRFSRTQEGRNRESRERERETLLLLACHGVPFSLLFRPDFCFVFVTKLENEEGRPRLQPSTSTIIDEISSLGKRTTTTTTSTALAVVGQPSLPPGAFHFGFWQQMPTRLVPFPPPPPPPPPLSYFFPLSPFCIQNPPPWCTRRNRFRFWNRNENK